MSNNIDFKLKNAVEVGGPTKVTLGSITSSDIDLATGNYFADTPTGESTYTISNAGDVQSFQLEVTGGTEEVAQNFSTTLYEGNATARTITNNIDLANDGGLVWIKVRNEAGFWHFLYDTERGATNQIHTNATNAETSDATSLTAFNSDGFSIGTASNVNRDAKNMVSWTFKEEPSFFDIVTYTGVGGLTQTINHSLDSAPGTIIVKRTDGVGNWAVYHRSTGATKYLELEDNAAAATNSTYWYDTEPTSTQFTVGNDSAVNNSGYTYVAYLFAHDDAADGLIQCGSYTGTGSSGNAVTLGWEPQWLMVKRTDATAGWIMVDAQRGMNTGADPSFFADASNAEDSQDDWVDATSTGFELNGSFYFSNASGGDYIYVAIRAASDLDLTWPSSIEWAGGVAPSAPATDETDVFTFVTDDGGTSYVGLKTADALS